MPAPTTLTPTVASLWGLDVDPAGTGAFIPVRGITNFKPGIDTTVGDATDYDSNGWGSDFVGLRKAKPSGTVMRKQNVLVYDPGQEALRVAALNPSVLLHARWYERKSNGEAWEGWAIVQWSPSGGKTEDAQNTEFTLLIQGEPQAIANPTAATATPVLSSALPGGAAAGAQVTVKGANLAGATGVKFAATAATGFVVVDAATIVAVVPAGSAGAANVTVTTPAGTSPALNYTRA